MAQTYRVIKQELDNDILVVRLPQFGMDIHYKIIAETTIDPDTKYDDGLPDITTDVNLDYIKTVKLKNAKSQKQIINILKKETIIPPGLLYDHILLGFVYADSSDPNNFRWWLDFRDCKNQNIYNYYTDKIEINCPVTTKAWHDQDPDGIWHGRFVLSPREVKTILEPKRGTLKINGLLKSQCKPLNVKNVCSIASIPDNTESLRLRYNTREDIWFCDVLDKTDNQIGQIPCKSVICDAKMQGEVKTIGDKPKVSIRINIKDISDVAIAINSLIIRGK